MRYFTLSKGAENPEVRVKVEYQLGLIMATLVSGACLYTCVTLLTK